MTTRIFLSYGRGDDDPDFYDPSKSFMRRLYNGLKAAGFEVWWDRETMPNRELTFLQEIRDAVTASDKLVLVVGEKGMASEYVRAEWEYALSIGKNVVPILRSGTYETLMPPERALMHGPDFRDLTLFDRKLAELVRILNEEVAPMGTLYGVSDLPNGYIERQADMQAVGDQGDKAVTLSNMGKEWEDLGEKRKALDYYEQALPLMQAVGDQRGEAITLSNIGKMWGELGEQHKALDYFQQALTITRALRDQEGEATTLNNIGAVWSALGEMRKALDYYERALPLRQALGDRRGEATTLNNMAHNYFDSGEVERAANAFQQLIKVLQEIGAVAEEAANRVNRAATLQHLNRTDESIAEVEQSIAILKTHDLPQDSAGQTLAQHEEILARLRGKAKNTGESKGFLGRLRGKR